MNDTVSITVLPNEVPPANLNYVEMAPAYVAGVEITPNRPMNGGGPASSYSISGSLPEGLLFDAATGVISGTPMALQVATPYVITASNSGGSTAVTLSVSVVAPDVPPELSSTLSDVRLFSTPMVSVPISVKSWLPVTTTVFLNASQVFQTTAKTDTANVALAVGKNTIEIRAIDAEGREAPPLVYSDLVFSPPALETGIADPAVISPAFNMPSKLSDALLEKISLTTSLSAWLTGRTDEFVCAHGVNLSAPETQPLDLAALDPMAQVTPEIQELASRLGSVERAYFYVRDNISFFPRFGLTQTATQALLSGVGTAADKAAVLISLLRALGVPAQYIAGDVLVDEDQLKGLHGVSGTKDLAWAEYVSLKGYFQSLYPSGFDGSEMTLYRSGKRAWRIPHIWVHARLELVPGVGQWVQLDPTAAMVDSEFGSSVYSRNSLSSIDYLFQNAGSVGTLPDLMRNEFTGSGTYEGTIGHMSPSVLNRYSSISFSSISVAPPCVRTTSEFIPLEYEFTSHVRVMDPLASNSTLLEKSFPLAALSGAPLSLTLRSSSVADASDVLEVKQGEFVLSSGPRPVGDQFALYHAIQEPLAYGGQTEARIVSSRPIAGVYVIGHSVAPVSSAGFHSKLRSAETTMRSPVGDQEKIVALLQLGSELALSKAAYHDTIINSVRGVGRSTEHLLLVNTRNGVLAVNPQSLFGFAPISVDMDWDMTGPIYSRSGDFSDFMQYDNIAYAKGELVVANSFLEGQVWNDLFGKGGTSAIHVLQRAYQSSTALIRGSELTPETLPEIQGQLDSSLELEFPLLERFANESPYLFSLTSAFLEESGWSGGAAVMVPSSPMGHAGAYLFSNGSGGALLGGNYQNDSCTFSEFSSSCIANYRSEFGDSVFYSYSEFHGSSRSYWDPPTCSMTSDGFSVYCSRTSYSPLQCEACHETVTGHDCAGTTEKHDNVCTYWKPVLPESSVVTNTAITSNQTANSSPSNTKGASSSCHIAQPVNVATGAMWHEFVDFEVAGRTPETALGLKRTYTTKPVKASNDFGANWWHNFETKLLFDSDIEGVCKGIELSAEAQELLASSGFSFELPTECLAGSPPQYAPIVYMDENGGPWTFFRNPDYSLRAPQGLGATLGFEGGTAVLRKKDGTRLVFSYDGTTAPKGSLMSIIEAHGDSVQLSYDQDGKLLTAQSSGAGVIRFVRNSIGLVESVTRERDGLTYTYGYNLDGKLVSSSDFDGNVTRYEYNQGQVGKVANGLLSAIIDSTNRAIRYSYYDDGRAFEQREPGNGEWSFFYSAPGSAARYVSVKNVDGNAIEFRLDGNGLIKEIIHPDGSSSRFSVQWNGTVIETDEMGAVSSKQFDNDGRLIAIRKPTGNVTTFQNDPFFGKPTLITTPAGSYSFEIDYQNGDVKRIINAETGLSLEFTYDSFGNVLGIANGRSSFANVRSDDGLLTQVFDARNPETRTYDSRNRVVTRSFASGRIFTYSWDDHDRITRIDDSHGPSTIQVWDKMGRLKERTITDGSVNQTTKYTWDDRDRLIEVTDAMNRTTKIEYDKIAIGCNVVDKPSVITDPAGRKTQFFYDLRQRLTRVVDANGGVTRYEYNARGDLIGVTDPENTRTRFVYDQAGRLMRRERPTAVPSSDGAVGSALEITNYTWDAADRLIKEEKGLANGIQLVTEYEWDALSRLTRKHQTKQQNGQIIEDQDDSHYTYQPQMDVTKLATANNGVAQLSFTSEAVPPFAQTAYSVAAADLSNPLALIEGNYTVARDVTGEIAGIVDANGKTILTAQFDPAGRMTKIASGDFITGQSLGFTITPDSFGRKRGVVSTTGLVSSYSYDLLNQVTSIYHDGNSTVGGPVEHYSEVLTYNAQTGNIDKADRELGAFTYQHDPLDQVLAVAYSGTQPMGTAANQAWSYDYARNRTSQGTRTLANVLVQDQVFKYIPDSLGTGSLSQRIDLATSVAENFAYRADQMLTSYDNGNGTSEAIQYDALGRVVSKAVNNGGGNFTQGFAYLGESNTPVIARTGDGSIFVYLNGQQPNEHFGHVSSNGAQAYAADHVGSVVNTDVAGAAHAFGVYGELLGGAPSVSAPVDPVSFAWQGQPFDRVLKMTQHGPRYANSSAGRWTTADPIFPLSGPNPFVLDANNPVKYIDPSGLDVLFFQIGGDIFGGSGMGRGSAASSASGFGLNMPSWNPLNWNTFPYTTTATGTNASGAYASGGLTGGYFTGSQQQFMGPGSATTAAVGWGMQGGSVSVIQSGGAWGFSLSIRGPGIGIGACGTKANTNPFP